MHMGLLSGGSHLKCCSSESCTQSWWLAVSCCAGTGSREHPLGKKSSWFHLIVMFTSSARSVLHGVILLLLSTMILCSAKSWPWILLSTQRRKSRTQQRGPAVVLSLNSSWMVSGPGDNRNWIHSWQLQTWVWMWLLEVVREMFIFQVKQFCKILRESTSTPWCSFVTEAVSEVYTLIPKASIPNTLTVRRAAGSFP